MLKVIEPGLETSVQDLPGRIGYWEQGFPPSGPMDAWSFRLANLLVGNDANAAALECQFLGPRLRFLDDRVIAVTGGDMAPTLDGEPVAMWQSFAVTEGQELALAGARKGARAYIAISGGIATEPVLGSRSTFHMAGVGGVDGHALKADQKVPLGTGQGMAGRRVKEKCRPPIDDAHEWSIEVVAGPDDDWIDKPGRERFLSSAWTVQAKSARTGLRLSGPEWTFSERAYNKRPEHGADPSNILDHGYPLGAVNLAGQTPIILVNDAPSTGGFINPYTVPTAAFWKLGQSLPGDIYHFVEVSVTEAQEMRRRLDTVCSEESIAAAV